MKRILIVIAILMSATFVTAQNKETKPNIPPVVTDAFAKLYPAIKTVKWEVENGNFEANFDLNKVETSVTFDPIGTYLETESEIKVSDLPKSAVQYVAKKYPEVKIKEASKIKDAKGIVSYEAAWKGTEITFDEKGNFIKEHKEPVTNVKD